MGDGGGAQQGLITVKVKKFLREKEFSKLTIGDFEPFDDLPGKFSVDDLQGVVKALVGNLNLMGGKELDVKHLSPIFNGYVIGKNKIVASILIRKKHGELGVVYALYYPEHGGYVGIKFNPRLNEFIRELSHESILNLAMYNTVLRLLESDPFQPPTDVRCFVDSTKFAIEFPAVGYPVDAAGKTIRNTKSPSFNGDPRIGMVTYLKEFNLDVDIKDVLCNFESFTSDGDKQKVNFVIIYMGATGYGVIYTAGLFIKHNPDLASFVNGLNMGKGNKARWLTKIKDDIPSLKEDLNLPSNLQRASALRSWQQTSTSISQVIMEGDGTGQPLHHCLMPIAKFIEGILKPKIDAARQPVSDDTTRKQRRRNPLEIVGRFFALGLHTLLTDIIELSTEDERPIEHYFDLRVCIAHFVNCKANEGRQMVEKHRGFQELFNDVHAFFVDLSLISKFMHQWMPKQESGKLLWEEFASSVVIPLHAIGPHPAPSSAASAAADKPAEDSAACSGRSKQKQVDSPENERKPSKRPKARRRAEYDSDDGDDEEESDFSEGSEESLPGGDLSFIQAVQGLRKLVLQLTRACWQSLAQTLVDNLHNYLQMKSQGSGIVFPYNGGQTLSEQSAVSMLFVEAMERCERRDELSMILNGLFIPDYLFRDTDVFRACSHGVYALIESISEHILQKNLRNNIISTEDCTDFEGKYERYKVRLSDLKPIVMPTDQCLANFFIECMQMMGREFTDVDSAMKSIKDQLQSSQTLDEYDMTAQLAAPAQRAPRRNRLGNVADEDAEANPQHAAAAESEPTSRLRNTRSLSAEDAAGDGPEGGLDDAPDPPDAGCDADAEEVTPSRVQKVKNPGKNKAKELQALLDSTSNITAGSNIGGAARGRTSRTILDPSKGATSLKKAGVIRGMDIPEIQVLKQNPSQKCKVLGPVVLAEKLQFKSNDPSFPARKLGMGELLAEYICDCKLVPSFRETTSFACVAYTHTDGSTRQFFVDVSLLVQYMAQPGTRVTATKQFRVALRAHPARDQDTLVIFVVPYSGPYATQGSTTKAMSEHMHFAAILKGAMSKDDFDPSKPIPISGALESPSKLLTPWGNASGKSRSIYRKPINLQVSIESVNGITPYDYSSHSECEGQAFPLHIQNSVGFPETVFRQMFCPKLRPNKAYVSIIQIGQEDKSSECWTTEQIEKEVQKKLKDAEMTESDEDETQALQGQASGSSAAGVIQSVDGGKIDRKTVVQDLMNKFIVVNKEFNLVFIVVEPSRKGGKLTVVLLNAQKTVSIELMMMVRSLLESNRKDEFKKIYGPVRVVVDSSNAASCMTVKDLKIGEIPQISDGSECVLLCGGGKSLKEFIAEELSVSVTSLCFRTVFSLCCNWVHSPDRNPLVHTCDIFSDPSRTVQELANEGKMVFPYYPVRCQETRNGIPVCAHGVVCWTSASRWEFVGCKSPKYDLLVKSLGGLLSPFAVEIDKAVLQMHVMRCRVEAVSIGRDEADDEGAGAAGDGGGFG